MKKISNREEANKYYKLVNNAINDFMGETKARPSEVHKYLTKNGVKFLKKLELCRKNSNNVIQKIIYTIR